jgi:hypothetical protein
MYGGFARAGPKYRCVVVGVKPRDAFVPMAYPTGARKRRRHGQEAVHNSVV